MGLMLNIDTHLQEALVCLSANGNVINYLKNSTQKEHASFLQPAIQQLMAESERGMEELTAVAVVAGPGSYTGLRVGLAASKGLCFVLHIPLILISSLEWMAASAGSEDVDLICPMIDARRSEVYTAIYRPDGTQVVAPTSVILEGDSFRSLLKENRILFFGNGSEKFRLMVSDNNAIFKKIIPDCQQLAVLSLKKYRQSVFADLAYSEPYYLKTFDSNQTPRQA